MSFSWSKPQDLLGQSTARQAPQGAGASQGLSLSFSSQTPAALGASTAQPSTSQIGPSHSVVDQLQKIKDLWDPTSASCAFQYYFYNKVPVEQVPLYTKPVGQDQAKWDEAQSKRPDASSVPVLAVGFSDLQKRTALQANQVNAYRARMHEINDKLGQLAARHDLYSTVKMAEMKVRHRKLVHRTLALSVKIQVLKSRGYVLRPDEEVLRQKLEQLTKEIDDPAVFGRINEVWARMKVLRERARALEARIADYAQTASAAQAGSLDWERDSDQLEALARVLKAQQSGIAYLASTLKEDTSKLDVMMTKLQA